MNKKVDILIYSKDRACQLDLLLRSIKKYFKNVGQIAILHCWSDTSFEDGYDKLFENMDKYGLDINPIYQTDFAEDVKMILKTFREKNFLGICDDDVFIKECNVDAMLHELDHKHVNAISIKSGLNITHHYPNISVPQPDNFIYTKPYLMWSWKDQPRPTDWGYPTCINAYIYNIEYYLSLLERIEFNHPTILEAQCNTIREHFRPIMVGTTELKLLDIPCNRLQEVNDTPFGEEFAFTTEELNNKWLEGYEIDTSNIYERKVDRPNMDIAFKFIKESK